MNKTMATLLTAGTLLLPSLAFAHEGHGDLTAGLFHQLTGIDHPLALLALGAFGSLLAGSTRIRRLGLHQPVRTAAGR